MGSTIATNAETINQRTITDIDQLMLAGLKWMKDEGRLQDFTAQYGTHYISGLRYGGGVYSRFTLTAASREVKESIKESLAAKFKRSGMELKEELDRLQAEGKVTRVASEYFLQGAPLRGLVSPDVDEVKATIDRFSEEMRDSGRPSFPMYAICDEWENLKDVRDILDDKKVLPFVPSDTVLAISTAYPTLLYTNTFLPSLRDASLSNSLSRYTPVDQRHKECPGS